MWMHSIHYTITDKRTNSQADALENSIQCMREEMEERKAVDEEEKEEEQGGKEARLINLKWSQIAVFICEQCTTSHHSA